MKLNPNKELFDLIHQHTKHQYIKGLQQGQPLERVLCDHEWCYTGQYLRKCNKCGLAQEVEFVWKDVVPKKRCEPCQSTGASHCSDPENCGGPWDKMYDNQS